MPPGTFDRSFGKVDGAQVDDVTIVPAVVSNEVDHRIGHGEAPDEDRTGRTKQYRRAASSFLIAQRGSLTLPR